MAAYADTSFLGSYYLPDPNTPAALALVRSLTAPITFTALHRLELRNALALAVFQRRITAIQTQAVWQDLVSDLRTGLLAVVPLLVRGAAASRSAFHAAYAPHWLPEPRRSSRRSRPESAGNRTAYLRLASTSPGHDSRADGETLIYWLSLRKPPLTTTTRYSNRWS